MVLALNQVSQKYDVHRTILYSFLQSELAEKVK